MGNAQDFAQIPMRRFSSLQLHECFLMGKVRGVLDGMIYCAVSKVGLNLCVFMDRVIR